MAYIDFISKLHKNTKRDYIARVVNDDKAECAVIAKKYGKDYWDGDRKYGYGGYYYDGRWETVAKEMINHYNLKAGDNILDIGCGKGFLMYEFKKLMPELNIFGIDISSYAFAHSKPEIKNSLVLSNAQTLPFQNNSFDLVISIGALHNLRISELQTAISEINRVLKKPEQSYIMVESFRNEKERVNLLYWQLTCESFHEVKEWEWIYNHFNYKGDYSFIFFE